MDMSSNPYWPLVSAIMRELTENDRRPGVDPPLKHIERGGEWNRVAEAVERAVRTWLLAHELADGGIEVRND